VPAQHTVLATLKARYGTMQTLGFTLVSGTVAADTISRAV
jgi:hypothetical protein